MTYFLQATRTLVSTWENSAEVTAEKFQFQTESSKEIAYYDDHCYYHSYYYYHYYHYCYYYFYYHYYNFSVFGAIMKL